MSPKLLSIDHVAIICTDFERSKHFYIKVLGCHLLKQVYRPEKFSWKADLEIAGKYQIELFSFPETPIRLSFPEAAGLRHLALQVEHLEVWVEWLLEHKVSLEPIRKDDTRPGARFLFFKDPDGLPIELVEFQSS